MSYSKSREFRKSLLIALVIFLVYIGVTFVLGVINNVDRYTTKIRAYQSVIQYFSGLDKPKKILLLFENNAESRYGGGFIGTVGLVSIDKGKIKPDEIRSVYYYDYRLQEKQYTETDPKTNQITTGYTLRDSGQNLDWPTNAKRAAAIFEQESGQKVDGVVAVTPEVLKTLLKKTGPVYLDDYKKTITVDNLLESVQFEVETGVDKQNGKDPKTILASLGNKILEQLSNKNISDLSGIGDTLLDQFRARQALVYSPEYESANALKYLGFDGGLASFSSDYFLMSEKNLSIDKSNAFIERSLGRYVRVNPDGTVDEEVKITRNQTKEQSIPYADPRYPDVETWLIKNNTSEMKVALPAGSKLQPREGDTELKYQGKEGGYDAYSFTSSLMPLTPSEYVFHYRLPFVVSVSSPMLYSSLTQVQNGGFPIKNTQTVQVPKGFRLVASNKNQLSQQNNPNLIYNNTITQDSYLSLIYAKD